jgi:hypothetical protein
VIRKLREEHRAIEAQAAHLLRIVSARVPDSAAVAAMRWRMAQALRDHCGREDRLVYDWLLACGDSAAVEAASHYRSDHGALASAFAAYIADWPVQRIAREWQRFGEETRTQLAGLRDRIAREEQILYGHVERLGALRAAA